MGKLGVVEEQHHQSPHFLSELEENLQQKKTNFQVRVLKINSVCVCVCVYVYACEFVCMCVCELFVFTLVKKNRTGE